MVRQMTGPFEGIFGNSAELRLLEFLLPLRGMEFNLSELAEESGASRPTIQKTVARLEAFEILKVPRKAGNVRYYCLNEASPFISLLEALNNLLIERMLDVETLGRIHEVMQERAPRPPCRPPENELLLETETFQRALLERFQQRPTIPLPGVDRNAA